MKFITRLMLWALKGNLPTEDKSILTSRLLESIGALPIRDIITFNHEGTMIVDGKFMRVEDAIVIKNGAKALRDNVTRKIINEQRIREAIKIGVYNGMNQDQIMFAKAALWCIQEENKLIEKIDVMD